MKLIKLALAALGIALASFLLIRPVSATNNITAKAAHGMVKVDGENVVVTIWVAVNPNENASKKAQDTLKRAYPEARLLSHEEFSTTGLFWDIFTDNDSGNNQVTVNYNDKNLPSNLTGTTHRNFWVNAMAAWTSVNSSNFVFEDGGDTGRCPSLVKECRGPQKFDGNNDVSWINIADPSVLGVTWYGTQTDEFDMALDNKDFSWFIGDVANIGAGQFDTQTVWEHEFGHGLGLGHSVIAGSIMEAIYAGPRRILHQDDIDGITFLYPSGGATPTPTPTPTPTATPSATPTPAPTPTPQPGTVVSATSIDYTTYGGPQSNKHLDTSVTVKNDLGDLVSGATVSISLHNSTTNQTWTGAAATNGTGVVVFSLKNAPSGLYISTITNLTSSGLSWDSITPTNSFTK